MSLAIRAKINGHQWKIYKVSRLCYEEKFRNKKELAVTTYQHANRDRAIYFKTPASRDTVMHELLHAYLSYYDFRGVSYGQIEEAFCEKLPKIYRALGKTSNRIYKELKNRNCHLTKRNSK